MTKRTRIGLALVVALVAGVIGLSTLLAQSNGEMMVLAGHDFKTKAFKDKGTGGIAGAMRQAAEEGVIDQEAADEIVRAFAELPEGSAPSRNAEGGGKLMISASHQSKTFSGAGPDGIAGAVQQAVEEGVFAQETADRIVLGFDDDGPSKTWHHFSFSGEDGLAGALLEAVEEGVITQEMADQIKGSVDGQKSGS